MRYHKGSLVCLRPRFVDTYRNVYAIDGTEHFIVGHVEPRGRKNVLYLANKDREDWLPVYPGHVRRPKPQKKVRQLTGAGGGA